MEQIDGTDGRIDGQMDGQIDVADRWGRKMEQIDGADR